MPRVSVCIPCYNGADLLPRAIESVLSQDYTDYEIIVLNDGSTDNTIEVASAYPNTRVITIPNGGLSNARKVMVEESAGELIAFIDHDDEWLPGKLRKTVEYLDKTGADLVHTEGYYLYENGLTKLRNWRGSASVQNSWDHILPSCCIIVSSAVFKRDLMIKAGNFEPGVYNCSDWRGWFLLAKYARFEYLDEPLMNYFVRAGSLSQNGLRFFENEIKVLNEKIRPDLDRLFAEMTPAQQAIYRKKFEEAISMSYAKMAHMRWQEGKRGEALKFAKIAVSRSPGSQMVWRRFAAAILGRP